MWITTLVVLLLVLPLLVACGDSEEKTEPTGPVTSPEPVEIIIGNLTDKTGASANALAPIDMALADAVAYYNDENMIPGVKLKVIEYDGAYKPSNDIPGYEWLKERGADLIFTNVPATPISLKSRVNRDKMVLFTSGGNRETITPPGYIFIPAILPEENAYTLLKWVSEKDPDFPTDRPAIIGGAGWSTPYNYALHDAMEEYAEAYPDKFQWAGSYTIDLGFNWQTEIEALKDCDYVMLPIAMVNFIKQYRQAGYTGKFIGSSAQLAFLYSIRDARVWDEFDGTLFVLPSGWWNEDTAIINLTKELLFKNHPDSAEEIMQDGNAYIAIDLINQILEIIAAAVETVGPENFDSQALYDAAQSYSQTVDGVVHASFTETKRTSMDYLGVYEARAAQEDLFRVDEEWYPVVRPPEQ